MRSLPRSAERHLLLVLDGPDDAPVRVLERLTASAPRLTLLVTRRDLLGATRKPCIELRPLDESDAVTLFSERAAEARPDFRATDEDKALLREICRRLAGAPLAIELAAARVKLLALTALNERLEQRLAEPPADPDEAVRAAIEWSHELLSSDEQRLLAGLAVFEAGFTLEAAEAVCNARLDDLASLVEKAMVTQAGAPGEEPRFSLPAAIGQYADVRLNADGDASVLRDRHAEYFCALAEEERSAVERLAAEHENVRAVLRCGD